MKNWLTPETLIYLTAMTIVLATFVVGFIFNRFMKGYIQRSSGDLENDPTNYQFLRRAITILIYLVGFSLAIFSIPSLKTLAQSVLAGAGIAAVAVGFAAQAALSNIIAGVFIVIFKPFRVKDRVVVKDVISGIVEDITLRHTIIRNYENRRVIIPNSVISQEVILNSDMIEEKVCIWLELGVSFDSNIEKAKSILAEEAEAHPFSIDNRTQADIEAGIPKIMVRLISIGTHSLNLRAWVWAVDSANGFVLKCDLLESVKKRFDAEGIEIPYPYRAIINKESRLIDN